MLHPTVRRAGRATGNGIAAAIQALGRGIAIVVPWAVRQIGRFLSWLMPMIGEWIRLGGNEIIKWMTGTPRGRITLTVISLMIIYRMDQATGILLMNYAVLFSILYLGFRTIFAGAKKKKGKGK